MFFLDDNYSSNFSAPRFIPPSRSASGTTTATPSSRDRRQLSPAKFQARKANSKVVSGRDLSYWLAPRPTASESSEVITPEPQAKLLFTVDVGRDFI